MNSEMRIIRLQSHNMQSAEFYPYIAYINGEGNPNDTMLQSVLLDYSNTDSRLNEWEKAIYSLFRNGENLRALDSAMGDVKHYLRLPADYKCQIFISAPVPVKSREYFGDINGNGIAEKLLTNEDCARAFAWFADNLIRRFKACGFANIQLKGWILKENMDYLAEVVTQRGYECLFESDFALAPINGFVPNGNCIFNEGDENSLIACAVSQDNALRNIYDSIHKQIKAVREPEPAFENTAPAAEAALNPVAEAVEEAVQEEIIIPAETTVNEPVESVAETVEAVESVEAVAEAEEPLAPKRERVTIHKERITEPAENLKSIVLDIDISTGSPCPPPCQVPPRVHNEMPPMPPMPPKQPMDCKKKIAIGAGIAAAVLGIAYIIKK